MPKPVNTPAVKQRLHEAMDEAIQRAIAATSSEVHQLCVASEVKATPEDIMRLMYKYVAPAVAEDAMRTYYKIICEESEAQ
jgi:hypothetical protein